MPASHRQCLVFYDVERSEDTITQLGAVCHQGNFNVYTLPPGGAFKYHRGTTEYCTKVTARVDPDDGQQKLYHTLRKVFLPTVSSIQGFQDFLSWLTDMRDLAGTDSLSLLSWGKTDHHYLIKNFNATEPSLEDQLREIQGPEGLMLDAQQMVAKVLEPPRLQLGAVFTLLLPEDTFGEHDAQEDAIGMFKVYEKVKADKSEDDLFMMKQSSAFDPSRDQLMKKLMAAIIDTVMDRAEEGWLERAVVEAVAHPTVNSGFHSRLLADWVASAQVHSKWEQVECMLAGLGYTPTEVQTVGEDPLGGLKEMVADLRTQIPPAGKYKDRSVKLTAHKKTVFKKSPNLKEAEFEAATELIWQLLKAGKIEKKPL